MNELSLIPFGFRLSDKQFVDVSEVERGRKCNCICPSCNTPLIARQGEINKWCFAHVSKGVSKETKNECEYSFWLSVTSMAKQVIKSAVSINLPSLVMYTSDAKKVRITEQQEVQLNDVKIEKKVSSVSVDAILKIGGYDIIIFFTTPHKVTDNSIINAIGSDRIGVLEISLSDAYQWLFGCNNQGKHTQAIELNILTNINCKKWLHHPRKLIIEKKDNIELYSKRPIIMEKQLHYPRKPFVENHNINSRYIVPLESHYVEHKQYKCVICHHNWFGTNECINCKTHIYSTEVKN
jgi:hypothetical protein